MKKQIFIINGSGGVGKDTFVEMVVGKLIANELVAKQINKPVMNFSSVDKIKQIAKVIGWNGEKTEYNRKFLSDLKLLCIKYNDLPFNSMKEQVDVFLHNDSLMLFLHIREPDEIARAAKAFSAKTILIKRDSIKHIVSNMADKYVLNYDYDIIINNNGTITDYENKINNFVQDFLTDDIKHTY